MGRMIFRGERGRRRELWGNRARAAGRPATRQAAGSIFVKAIRKAGGLRPGEDFILESGPPGPPKLFEIGKNCS